MQSAIVSNYHLQLKALAIDLWVPLLGWIWQKAQSLPAHSSCHDTDWSEVANKHPCTHMQFL